MTCIFYVYILSLNMDEIVSVYNILYYIQNNIIRIQMQKLADLQYIAIITPVICQRNDRLFHKKPVMQKKKGNCITTNFYSEAHLFKKIPL